MAYDSQGKEEDEVVLSPPTIEKKQVRPTERLNWLPAGLHSSEPALLVSIGEMPEIFLMFEITPQYGACRLSTSGGKCRYFAVDDGPLCPNPNNYMSVV